MLYVFEIDSSVSDSESDSGSSSSGSSTPARQRTPPKRVRAYDKSVGNERKLVKRGNTL